MSKNFKKIFDELIAISFETPDYIDEINFSSIKQSLCFTVATCLTSKSSLKKEIDSFFESWLNSCDEDIVLCSGRSKTEVYEALTFEENLFLTSVPTSSTDNSIDDYKKCFRGCVRELYPKITEAAQNIKERIEMPATQIDSTQVREPKKTVKWADRYPSSKSSASNISL